MLSTCTILAVSKLSPGFKPGVLGSEPSVSTDYTIKAKVAFVRIIFFNFRSWHQKNTFDFVVGRSGHDQSKCIRVRGHRRS